MKQKEIIDEEEIEEHENDTTNDMNKQTNGNDTNKKPLDLMKRNMLIAKKAKRDYHSHTTGTTTTDRSTNGKHMSEMRNSDNSNAKKRKRYDMNGIGTDGTLDSRFRYAAKKAERDERSAKLATKKKYKAKTSGFKSKSKHKRR